MSANSENERPENSRAAAVFGYLGFIGKHVLLWLLLALVAYWAWLDHDVVGRFGQRQWALPARIYAAPMELIAGLSLTQEQLAKRLSDIGYRAVDSVNGPGQFSVTGHTLTLHSRGFASPDGLEPSRDVVIYFAQGRLSTLANRVGGDAVAMVRVDPLEIGRLHTDSFEDRVPIVGTDLPDFFLRSLIAVEDQRFPDHIGVDGFGILRAAFANLRSGSIAQGGSTLTQQLAKNLFLSRERRFSRKFKEALIAISLERAFGKREILEAYVNEVFLGQDGNRAIHGFGLASRFYFGRPLNELGVAEQALLIGLIRGPSQYNPFRYPERALERRNVVLARMRDSDIIDANEFARYSGGSLQLRKGAWRGSSQYAGFLDLVARQLTQDYQQSDLETAGLKVYTTLDVATQSAAELAVAKVLTAIEIERPKQRGKLQAAVVIAEPRSADIKALVGDRAGMPGGFNRALDARRQIGSLMKPFVYLTALADSARFNVATRLNDEPRTWRGADGKAWSPENYDKRFHGGVSVEYALAHSLNLATLDLGFKIGLPRLAQMLKRLGVESPLPQYPSLFLGAVEMTPYELAQLYQTIANDGLRTPLRAIKAVVDVHNNLLQRNSIKARRVLDEPTAYLVRHLLTRVVATGTARSLALALPQSLPLAGKTGTSDQSRDSWFAGFGGDALGVAWIGRDDNHSVGLTGASGALRVWIETLREVGITPVNLEPPPTIEWHRVTADGASLVGEDCLGAALVPLNIEHLPNTLNSCEAAPDGVLGSGQNLQR